MSNLASFWRPEAGDETVLPDMSFLIGQKFVENVKIEKLKNAIFWVIFKHYDCTGKMWNAKKKN